VRLPYSRHEMLTDSYEEHKQIVDAVEAGDRKAALKALKTNILKPFKAS